MSERSLEPEILNQWIGKTETHVDILDAKQANLMAATLGHAQTFKTGDALPALWHWIYFLNAQPAQDLGRDGHPKLGGFLPAVALPRRMWAGGRFQFSSPLRIGEEVLKTSKIKAVEVKHGRTGALCFVTVAHCFTVDGVERMTEEHDIVYRQDPKPDQPKKRPPVAPTNAEQSTRISAGPTLLFRYSALTFNGHRIHYDRDYCRDVEGYPDLVVHGPLIATLLIQHAVAHNAGKVLKKYSFRALSPICGEVPFNLNLKHDAVHETLWASTLEGALAMQATADFSA